MIRDSVREFNPREAQKNKTKKKKEIGESDSASKAYRDKRETCKQEQNIFNTSPNCAQLLLI